AEARIRRGFNGLVHRLRRDTYNANEAIHRESEGETRPPPTSLERDWCSAVRYALKLASDGREQHSEFQTVTVEDLVTARTLAGRTA
ncbi:MAG: hypothetical protein Q9187_007615, partial [Circinaria calcarea]